MSIHGFQPIVSSSRDAASKHSNTSEVNVFHVSQAFALDNSTVRSLVTESSNIFYNLQTAKDKSNDIFLRTSRAYRSAIRTTLNKLQEAIDATSPEDVRKYENFVTIFYSIECLWHLCEFLLIDHTTMSVVPNLLEWVSCFKTIVNGIAQKALLILDKVPFSIGQSKRCRDACKLGTRRRC